MNNEDVSDAGAADGKPVSDDNAQDEVESDETDLELTDPAVAAPALARRGPSRRRAGALIGVLLALLGFGIAVQVHSNASTDSLSGASQEDLIRILDDQNQRADRLRQEISSLQTTITQLQASGNRDSVAEQQAEQEAQALEVLLGTIPATGPGVAIQITDPQHGLKAEDLLDVIEELRGAGAEAIQFSGVRVSTSTAFVDDGNAIAIDGTRVSQPYTVLAIGDTETLETALEIPGGVSATVRAAGGTATIAQQQKIDITSVRPVQNPSYAKVSGK